MNGEIMRRQKGGLGLLGKHWFDEIVSLEVVDIVIPEVEGIDTDILLTIKDDILREKLLNVNLFIANIEALKDNPTPSSDIVTKSSSTSLNLFLEETNTFDNSLTESFCFDLEEISSASTTTHSNFSQYDSFIFDLSINPFPPADRSDFHHEEFADELAHIISPPEFILLSEPLFAYIVWIFLPFLTYPVAPPYLLSCGNEDTIFDPGISIYHSFMPDVSHRSGTFMKFNVYPNHLNERCPGFLKPLVLFVLRSQELHNPQLHFGNPDILILSTNVYL
ncbi:hypothetical protein Tco_1204508 [Tanacetum coccineum]